MISEPAELERQVKAIGSNMAELCRRAGVHRSLFTRWKAGQGGPTWATLKRWDEALEELRQEQSEDAA